MHEKLLRIIRKLDEDFKPFGRILRDDQPDCSCGCRHFTRLAHDVGEDWGVCINHESPRAGLLTFEHQGCSVFEPITVDHSLADSQLRRIIAEASELLKDRRERKATTELSQTQSLAGVDEFSYDVKTSYFPKIKGHFPAIFRLEQHEGSFVAIPLETQICGSARPAVIARCSAKNGEVFKIVRENGEFSYLVPLNGKIYNLKQYGDLSRIGLPDIEVVRLFLECVESEVFDKIVGDTASRLERARRDLQEGRDRVRRWRQKQFWPDETPGNERERREMLKEEEANVTRGPTQIVELEAFTEWLNNVDRSNPRLAAIPAPPPPLRGVEEEILAKIRRR
jgi:hypothetical protein